MKNKTVGVTMMLITTIIWGTAFVAQRLGSNYLGAFTFNGIRFLLGALVLLPFIFLRNSRRSGRGAGESGPKAGGGRMLLTAGIVTGALVYVTVSLQQVGIAYTTAGKAGFVSVLYIVIVPVIGLCLGRHIRVRTWLCIALATAGLYFLCMNEKRFTLGLGDTLMLLSTVTTAFNILATDYYSTRVDCVKLSCLQLVVCGVLSLGTAFLFEKPTAQAVLEAAGPILYTGILSCGVAFTLKISAQKVVPPVATSLILSLQSVFSVLAGWLFLQETLSGREAVGCALMFVAIVLAQLPARKKNRRTDTVKALD